jgi:hypothetical protein
VVPNALPGRVVTSSTEPDRYPNVACLEHKHLIGCGAKARLGSTAYPSVWIDWTLRAQDHVDGEGIVVRWASGRSMSRCLHMALSRWTLAPRNSSWSLVVGTSTNYRPSATKPK